MIKFLKSYYYLYQLKNTVFRFDSPIIVPIGSANWCLMSIDGGEVQGICGEEDHSTAHFSLDLDILDFEVLEDIYKHVKASK